MGIDLTKINPAIQEKIAQIKSDGQVSRAEFEQLQEMLKGEINETEKGFIEGVIREFEPNAPEEKTTLQQLEDSGRQITEDAKEEIKSFVKEHSMGVLKYTGKISNAISEELNAMEQDLIEAWEAGENAYKKAKQTAEVQFQKIVNKAMQLKEVATEFVTEDVPETLEKGTYVAIGAAKAGVEAVGEFVTEDIPEAYDEAKEWVGQKVDDGVALAQETYADVKDGIKAGAQAVEDGAKAAGEWIAETYNEAEKEVKDAVNEGVEWVGEKYAQAENAVNEGIEAAEVFVTEDIPEALEKGTYVAIGAAKAGVEAVEDFVTEDVPEAYNEAKEWAGEKYAQAKKTVKETVNDGAEWVGEKYAQAKEGTKELIAKGEELVNDGLKAGKELVDDGIDAGKELLADADEGIRNTGRKAKDKVKGAFDSMKVDVPTKTDRTQALENATGTDKLELEGRNVVDNIKTEAAETWNETVDGLKGVAKEAYNGMKKLYNWLTGG